jgi:hypothetical protein
MPTRLLIAISIIALEFQPPLTLAAAEKSPDFEREVAPLLVAHCVECKALLLR